MKRLIYPILILLLSTMACSFGSFGQQAPTKVEPSATPLFVVPTDVPVIAPLSATDTAVPPQPTTSPKSNPTATTQTQGGLNTGSGYFNEDFKGNADNWKQWVAAGDPSKNYTKLTLGRLRFEMPSPETYAYVQNSKFSYKDVLTVATFETVESNGTNGIALFCRYSDKGWYEARVSTMGDSSTAGRVSIYRYDPRLKSLNENPYVNLLTTTYNLVSIPISTIKNGFNTNTIGFQCSGNTLSVYANGSAMIHPRLNVPIVVNDSTLTDGTVGVGVMSFSNGKAIVEFTGVSTNKPQ
jgi:hypothetical protein